MRQREIRVVLLEKRNTKIRAFANGSTILFDKISSFTRALVGIGSETLGCVIRCFEAELHFDL